MKRVQWHVRVGAGFAAPTLSADQQFRPKPSSIASDTSPAPA